MLYTFEKIKELSKKRGLSLNQLEEKLGYSRNTLYSLKRQNVSTKRLQEIADYLEVSVDYLLGKRKTLLLLLMINQAKPPLMLKTWPKMS
nr:MAG TPA: repressor protein [Caudoviricetes sp.]